MLQTDGTSPEDVSDAVSVYRDAEIVENMQLELLPGGLHSSESPVGVPLGCNHIANIFMESQGALPKDTSETELVHCVLSVANQTFSSTVLS